MQAMSSDPLSGEEKRRALDRVLASRTLARSEQLRAFLRYVCEAEFEGRAQELNEYALGVAVLGRPASYSPAEDSCVRSRAYELRNKLGSYYRSEAADEPVLIEIDKGAYVPRFVRREEKAEPTPKPAVADVSHDGERPPALTAAPAVGPQRRSGPRVALSALALVALVAAVAAYGLRPPRERPSVNALRTSSRELDALWRPFVTSSAPLLVSFEIRPFFFSPGTGLVIRDYRVNNVAEVASSEPLRQFRERMGAEELRETNDYADFGAVHAGFLLGRLLNREVALKHSNALGWEDIWNSNIVFIGKPSLNPTIRYALQGKDFVESEYGNGIRNLHPRPGERDVYRIAETHGAGEKYALISVMPGPQAGRHMMILSGAGAELMWALAEAVTNAERVKELVSRVALPSGELPPAYQVVISARFESNVPVKIRYVTHRVSKNE
jgi:hypothetical protein